MNVPNLIGEDKSPIHVVVEKQGQHSTEVDLKALEVTIGAMLYQLYVEFNNGAVIHPGAEFKSHEPFMRAIENSTIQSPMKEEWCWRANVRSVHVRGESHFLRGTLRAYEVTDYNTLDIIVQTGNAQSRRRCDLIAPKALSPSERRDCFYVIMGALRPETSVAVHSPAAVERRDRIIEATTHALISTKKRTAEFKAREFCNTMIRSKSKKKKLIELIDRAMGSRDYLSESELVQAIKSFWQMYAPPQVQNPTSEAIDYFLATSTMITGLVDETSGNYIIGEYGCILLDEITEEKRNIRQKQLETEIRAIESNIQRSQEKIKSLEQTIQSERESLANLQDRLHHSNQEMANL